YKVTGVQTCALPISGAHCPATVEVPPPADDISSAAHSRVAQLVEQPAVNRRVAGSSPASGAPQIHLSQRVLAQPRNPPWAPGRLERSRSMDRGGFPEVVGLHLDGTRAPARCRYPRYLHRWAADHYSGVAVGLGFGRRSLVVPRAINTIRDEPRGACCSRLTTLTQQRCLRIVLICPASSHGRARGGAGG